MMGDRARWARRRSSPRGVLSAGETVQTDLVIRASHGDEDAFAELAAAAIDRLYAVAQRILRDTGAAEDAVQHALVARLARAAAAARP